MAHQITGYRFFTKGEKNFVIYSTLYKSGRFASLHNCTGLTEEQARGKFIVEHSNEVDLLLMEKQNQERKHKIILS
jgi:hypothetical protein